ASRPQAARRKKRRVKSASQPCFAPSAARRDRIASSRFASSTRRPAVPLPRAPFGLSARPRPLRSPPPVPPAPAAGVLPLWIGLLFILELLQLGLGFFERGGRGVDALLGGPHLRLQFFPQSLETGQIRFGGVLLRLGGLYVGLRGFHTLLDLVQLRACLVGRFL